MLNLPYKIKNIFERKFKLNSNIKNKSIMENEKQLIRNKK